MDLDFCGLTWFFEDYIYSTYMQTVLFDVLQIVMFINLFTDTGKNVL